ncbi:MAG: threonine--tRNA ligase [Chloroflexi bacterium]|nr:threonine--tRNA ligase [Chloroflexota bacterium]
MAKQHNMPEELYRLRHSLAHILAQAVLERYPEAQPTIGPPVENGFYYDFAVAKPFTPEDLEVIEGRMKAIVKGRHAFTCREVTVEEARGLFAHNPFKLELIEGLVAGQGDDMGEEEEPPPAPPAPPAPRPPGEGGKSASAISVYTQDTFTDLCRGPHVGSTQEINPEGFKLTSTSGAYWRGDEHKAMLQRIYGVAFKTRQELDDYLRLLEEIEKRDHRRLGKDLDLFHIDSTVGPGLVLWHPKGALIKQMSEDFCRQEHLANGYQIVSTPHVGRAVLWETSGHLDFYKENMYSAMEMDSTDYYVKPMNCPFHIMIYNSTIRSYRDLPIRYAEWGTVYRFERAGVLHGLLRVRGFTQDDAHIFCSAAQMPAEIDRTLKFGLHILRSFGFERFNAYLATRPVKSVGEAARWDEATEALRHTLERCELPYELDEGGGAFYGPKIDLKIRDAIGREWQCSTIQFDFNLSERFDMSFINEKGERERPYMIHHALLGSMERFMGVLIEHYAGAFPLWLAPLQVMIIPIADRHVAYANQVAGQLQANGMRVQVDDGAERMQNKIRKAQSQKVPYMLVVGDKEQAAGAVAVRLRTGEDLKTMPLEQFIAHAVPIMKSRAASL